MLVSDNYIFVLFKTIQYLIRDLFSPSNHTKGVCNPTSIVIGCNKLINTFYGNMLRLPIKMSQFNVDVINNL